LSFRICSSDQTGLSDPSFLVTLFPVPEVRYSFHITQVSLRIAKHSPYLPSTKSFLRARVRFPDGPLPPPPEDFRSCPLDGRVFIGVLPRRACKRRFRHYLSSDPPPNRWTGSFPIGFAFPALHVFRLSPPFFFPPLSRSNSISRLVGVERVRCLWSLRGFLPMHFLRFRLGMRFWTEVLPPHEMTSSLYLWQTFFPIHKRNTTQGVPL